MRTPLFLIGYLTMAGAALRAGPTAISGFVDASWVWETAAENGEFGLDQVEIDIEHQASDKTFMRADLEWVKNGEEFEARAEQAFMTYVPRCGWAFTLGKFNAPIGFELLDAPDMYQFSHSLVFDFGLPTNLTGFSVGKDLSQGFDLIAYGVNGWDQNTEPGGNVTWGGRLGYARDGFAGGLSAISGKEKHDAMDPFTRSVLDVDLNYELSGWVLGAEVNRGAVTLADDSEAEWLGFLLMAHHDFTDRSGPDRPRRPVRRCRRLGVRDRGRRDPGAALVHPGAHLRAGRRIRGADRAAHRHQRPRTSCQGQRWRAHRREDHDVAFEMTYVWSYQGTFARAPKGAALRAARSRLAL